MDPAVPAPQQARRNRRTEGSHIQTAALAGQAGGHRGRAGPVTGTIRHTKMQPPPFIQRPKFYSISKGCFVIVPSRALDSESIVLITMLTPCCVHLPSAYHSIPCTHYGHRTHTCNEHGMHHTPPTLLVCHAIVAHQASVGGCAWLSGSLS